MMAEDKPALEAKPAPVRLVSLDAMRGFVMFLLLGGGEIGHAGFLSALFAAIDQPWAQTLYHQLQYSSWGDAVHVKDLIRPLFIFVVGVAMPYPMVVSITTGSWVLFVGAVGLGLSALFYLVVDLWGFRKSAFFFVVIGANSIAVYMAAHLFDFRNGAVLVEPQSAQTAQPGDIIYTPPAKVGGGSHVELLTAVEKSSGKVTAVRVEDSWPPTTRNILRNAANFDSHISSGGRRLYRITDFDAWRKQNEGESFLFPNYDEDSAKPAINRVLLLDRGDWVPYFKDQPVKVNIMDKDSQGVQSLVIKRGDVVVEQIAVRGRGVIERQLPLCGDYTAQGVMRDGSLSPACEFSVCDLAFSLPVESPSRGKPWDITFTAGNLSVMAVQLMDPKPPYHRYCAWLTEQDRRSGKATVPAGLVRDAGPVQVWMIGENKYGRLTKEQEVVIVE